MQKLTKKERLELEEVFSAIYIKKESKLREFYRLFYKKLFISDKKIKLAKT